MITKIIYDLKKLMKITLSLTPNENGSTDGSLVKFFPTGASENITYTTTDLSTDTLPDEELTQSLYYIPEAPPPFINALLSNSVILDESGPYQTMVRLLVGVAPQLTAAM